MYKIIRPDRDSTIFGYNLEKNAGIDEILELNTICGPDGFEPSRILIDFGEFLPDDVELDGSGISGEEGDVFAETGFSEEFGAGSNENVFVEIGLNADFLRDDTNSFANFGFTEGVEGSTKNVLALFGFEDLTPDNSFAQFGFEEGAVSSPTNSFAEFGTGFAVEDPSGFNVFRELGVPKIPRRENEFERGPDRSFMPDERETSLVLRMWFANAQGLPKDYTLEAHRVEAQWVEGHGRATNEPHTTDPVNWIYRKEDEAWERAGGDFDRRSSATERFFKADPDVNMDVEPLFAGGVENGILIKREDESLERKSELKFFGTDSSTIFKPHLLLGMEDYQFDPAEEAEQFQSTESMSVFVENLRDDYKRKKSRFKVKVREKFPQRDFLGIRPSDRIEEIEDPEAKPFLPERSLVYEVKDEATGHVVFPFSKTFTAVSFEQGIGHYFDLDLSGVFPKRDYEIRFKFIDPETGNGQLFDSTQTFRVND